MDLKIQLSDNSDKVIKTADIEFDPKVSDYSYAVQGLVRDANYKAFVVAFAGRAGENYNSDTAEVTGTFPSFPDFDISASFSMYNNLLVSWDLPNVSLEKYTYKSREDGVDNAVTVKTPINTANDYPMVQRWATRILADPAYHGSLLPATGKDVTVEVSLKDGSITKVFSNTLTAADITAKKNDYTFDGTLGHITSVTAEKGVSESRVRVKWIYDASLLSGHSTIYFGII